MVVGQEIGQFRGLYQVGWVVLLALERQKGFDALIGLQVGATIAFVILVAVGLRLLLQQLIGQYRAMHVEMDDMVVADTVLR